jgi:hypothetical protein
MRTVKFAKGARRQVEVCSSAWVDLLGYGDMIDAAGFDPLSEKAQQALDRIHAFQRVLAQHSGQLFSSFVMNDGAAIHRDLSPRTHSVTDDFISRCWALYKSVDTIEKDAGHPGARMIVAAGLRARPIVREARATHRRSLLDRLENGVITPQQAVSEAVAVPRNSDVVPEFQGNFALTRAYMADAGGSRVGLPGPAFYLDAALVTAPVPAWLTVSREIAWTWKSMSTTFLEISEIKKWRGAHREGASNAIQVAERLTGDAAYGEKLQTVRVKTPRVAGPLKGP